MEDVSNFDDLLIHLGTGRWNFIYFMAAAILFFEMAQYFLSVLYVAPALNYTCLPPDNTTRVSEDSCTYVKVTEDGAEVEEPCTEWDFDTSVFTNTLTSEFGLVCSRAYLRATYHSIYTFGTMITCLLLGYLADRYGRKTLAAVTSGMLSIFMISLSFMPIFVGVLVCRLLMGLLGNVSLYSLALEVCQIKHRSVVGILIGLPWALGTMAWGGLGYLIRDWRMLNLTSSVPFLLIFVLIYLMDESPRWLLVTGKEDKARRVVLRAARLNRVELPAEEHLAPLLQKTKEPKPNVEEEKTSKMQCGMPRILSTPNMRRLTIIKSALYVMTELVFSGLNLSSGVLSANPYLYVVLAGLMEVLGYAFTVSIINRWGRKVLLIISYFVCGISILSIVFVPADMSWLVLTLAMAGKLTVSGAYIILTVHQTELVPTEVRLLGNGVSVMSSGVGFCIAPYITDLLGSLLPWLPSAIFGVTSLAMCVLLAPLPETLGVPLPETAEDLNTLWKRKWTSSRTSTEV